MIGNNILYGDMIRIYYVGICKKDNIIKFIGYGLDPRTFSTVTRPYFNI